jgi:hypothetical protein
LIGESNTGRWNDGMMEYWSIGIMENETRKFRPCPIPHFSITPPLRNLRIDRSGKRTD